MDARGLEAEMAARLGWSRRRVAAVLDVVTHIVSHNLAAERPVSLPGFITFVLRPRAARQWFSPLLHRLLLLPPKTAIGVRVSKALRQRLRGTL